MKTKRNDDWMEQAEKLGQQLAEGLERFGDRVAKAIETIETKVGPQIKKAAAGINVEDRRPPPGKTVPVEEVGQGDVFELQNVLFMRLGPIPDYTTPDKADAVHLSSGDVRRFDQGTPVTVVDATLVVKSETESPAS